MVTDLLIDFGIFAVAILMMFLYPYELQAICGIVVALFVVHVLFCRNTAPVVQHAHAHAHDA
jgi:hypothetical protein